MLSSLKLLTIDYLSHILHDEFAWRDLQFCRDAASLLLRAEYATWPALVLLEALVRASLTIGAQWATLNHQHPVDAAGTAAQMTLSLLVASKKTVALHLRIFLAYLGMDFYVLNVLLLLVPMVYPIFTHLSSASVVVLPQRLEGVKPLAAQKLLVYSLDICQLSQLLVHADRCQCHAGHASSLASPGSLRLLFYTVGATHTSTATFLRKIGVGGGILWVGLRR